MIVWTGGSTPSKPSETPRAEWRVVKILLLEQVTEYTEYWHNNPSREVLEVYFVRARHDAHATIRESGG